MPEEEDIRVLLGVIQKLGELGSIQAEGTETVKVGFCVPEGLPIKRGWGKVLMKRQGQVSNESREKKVLQVN